MGHVDRFAEVRLIQFTLFAEQPYFFSKGQRHSYHRIYFSIDTNFLLLFRRKTSIMFAEVNDMIKAVLRKFVLKRIALADAYEMEEIIKSVMRRYGDIFSGWELVCVSLPKNDKKARAEQIQRMLAFCRRHDWG